MSHISKIVIFAGLVLTASMPLCASAKFNGNALRFIEWADTTELSPEILPDMEACFRALNPGVERNNADTLYLMGRLWKMVAKPENARTVFGVSDYSMSEDQWPEYYARGFMPAYGNAIEYFTKALRAGDERSREPLVSLYAFGWPWPVADRVYFTEPDTEKATALAEELAPSIPAELMMMIGKSHAFKVNYVFFEAEQATPHLKNALKWYELAGAAGCDKGWESAADVYLGAPFNDIVRGKATTDKMADRASAANLLSEYYESRDKKQWLKYLREAADRGHVYAEYKLGRFLAFHDVKHRDYAAAAKYLEDVVARGKEYQIMDAHKWLARIYDRGTAFGGLSWEQMKDKAATHYLKAMEAMDWDADRYRLALGELYEFRDCSKALSYLGKISADADEYPRALYIMARIYGASDESCSSAAKREATLNKLNNVSSNKKHLYLGMYYAYFRRNPELAIRHLSQAARTLSGTDLEDARVQLLMQYIGNPGKVTSDVIKLVEIDPTPKTCELAARFSNSGAEMIRYLKKALELYENQGEIYYWENGAMSWTPDNVIRDLYNEYYNIPKLEKLYRDYANRLGVEFDDE